MHLDLWTLLLQAINLLVLLALLRWLLYKPLMAVIDQRQQRVSSELAAAQTARLKAEQESLALTAQRAAMDATREQALSAARQAAEAERLALMASANAAVAATQTQARQQLATERQQASQALMSEASLLAVNLATRLIDSSPATTGNAEFVEALLQRLDATPAADRQRWLGDAHPIPVTLVCASPADQATRQKVKDHLAQSLGGAVNLAHTTKADLLRGAELHFEHGLLSQSWAAELAAAQADMQQPAP